MGYLALYRRFRPTNFEGVIGQDAIVKTLTNQIVTDKIGHAYLFCGARGTGKTSLAKIFARAVNCLDSKNGSPCGKCLACKALEDVSNVDIIEMDAASNNKVENVRDIRESVQYPPVTVRYKVYIIDEVHMLTTEAFNALLKTLEEPPKHAIFVLATTEPHKLPSTILSRCMRFDFKLISTKKIAELISNIYDEVGRSYEKEAIALIAKAGEGSVRDALSVADLCVSYGSDKLTYLDVLTVLGATDQTKIDGLIKAVFLGDTGSVLSFTDELSMLGKSIGLLSKELVGYLRDIAVVKTCKNAREILALPEDRYTEMKAIADGVSENRILRCIEILSSIENSLRYSTQPRAVLETALIKASMPENDYNIDALLSRIKALEEKFENLGSISAPKNIEKELEKPIINKEQTFLKKEEIKPIIVDEGLVPPPIEETFVQPPAIKVEEPIKASVDTAKVWGAIVRKLRRAPGKTILWVACQEMTGIVEGDFLKIIAGNENEKKLIESKDNFETLLDLAREFNISKIKVINGQEDNAVDQIDSVKAFFKDTLTIK